MKSLKDTYRIEDADLLSLANRLIQVETFEVLKNGRTDDYRKKILN
jgi:hypothetical protein